ncbi:hypothetical protein [Thalassotalea sp. SU-HH00458]|uniref:hypothetical protein n=1 Tax=Thalassotalea sp. SU-HH00458 TaxID=3127657 RepID=UPI00310A7E01
MFEKKLRLSHFERLQNSIKLFKSRCSLVSEKSLQLACFPEVVREQAYINYCVSSSTIPLLTETIRCAKLLPHDPIAKLLIPYMEKHIPEEQGHDRIALEDFIRLGGTKEQALERIPPGNISALLGSQYHLIRHHPVAFMGYLCATEVNHPTVEYVENLISISGKPRECFTAMLLHATVDIGHKEDIITTLNSLPLTEEHYKIIEMSAFQSYRYIALVMEDVCKVAPVNNKATA